MMFVYLILTLSLAGQPDAVVTVQTRLPFVQCEIGKAMYGQEWLASSEAWRGWALKDEKCSSKAEGSA
jgi:hypothetical protein